MEKVISSSLGGLKTNSHTNLGLWGHVGVNPGVQLNSLAELIWFILTIMTYSKIPTNFRKCSLKTLY